MFVYVAMVLEIILIRKCENFLEVFLLSQAFTAGLGPFTAILLAYVREDSQIVSSSFFHTARLVLIFIPCSNSSSFQCSNCALNLMFPSSSSLANLYKSAYSSASNSFDDHHMAEN